MGQRILSSTSKGLRRWTTIGLVSAVTVAAIGVAVTGNTARDAQASGDAGTVDPAVPVSVDQLTPQTVNPFSEFSGRINAVDYAEIRPQVVGRVTEIRFHDGQWVNAGDVLFVIDPRPYQAAVAKAEADLATALHNAKFAKLESDRGSQLVKPGAVSQENYDQRVNNQNVADAAVKSAAAVLASAQVNEDYAFIKAPISGRISRAEITVGNLVGSPTAPPPLLASVVSDNGVYADFEVDEQTYLNSVRSYGHTQEQQQKIPVEVIIRGDTQVFRGHLLSFDNRIDTASGTIRARALFDHTDGALIPGMYVSVRMGEGAIDNALVVPEGAVGNDQSKRFVFVATDSDKVEYRAVRLGPQVDGKRVILAGLKRGDRVILDHLQRLAPGAPVRPHINAHQQTDSRTASK
jgi:membrane fusion protein, multidrug efflux system